MSNEPIGTSDLFGELEYIAASPEKEHGGFHPRVVAAAAGAIAEIQRLRGEAPDKGVGCDALLACPWCKESGFDDVGLKIHISAGFCEHYNALSISLPRTRQANIASVPCSKPTR